MQAGHSTPSGRERLRSRARAGFWLLLSLACCLTGQVYFQFQLPILDGVLFYAVGCWAFWRFLGQQQDAPPALTLAVPPPVRFAYAGLGVAGLAMAVEMLAAARAATENQGAGTPAQVYVLVVAVLWVTAGLLFDGPLRLRLPVMDRRHALGLTLVLLTAALVRLRWLDAFPAGVWFDEASIGNEAWDLLTKPNTHPMYSVGTTTPAAFVYLVSLVEGVLGKTVLAVRLAPALCGIGSTILTYGFARQAFGARTALIAAALFAVARWDIDFSRIGMQGATTPFLTLLAATAAIGAVRTGRRSCYALLGVTVGSLIWFYTSNLMFLVVLGVGFLALAVRQWRVLPSHGLGLALVFGGALLVSAPAVVEFVLQPDQLLNRPQQASILASGSPESLPTTLSRSIQAHLKMFQISGDRNGRHNLPGAPMLDLLTGMFLILGLVVALRRWRDPTSVLLLAWLPLMLAPGILSLVFEAPQALRSIGAIVPVVLLAALGLSAATSRLRAETGNWVLLVVLLVAGFSNVTMYFGLQGSDPDVWEAFSQAATQLGRAMQSLPEPVTIYGSRHYTGHPTVRFLTDRQMQPLDPNDVLPLRTPGDAMLFFAPQEPAYFDLAATYYPNNRCQPVVHPASAVPIAYRCDVTATDVAAPHGMRVRLAARSEATAPPLVISAPEGEIALPPSSNGYALQANSSLLAGKYGEYVLALDGPATLQVFVDGTPVVSGGSVPRGVTLAQGLHSLDIVGQTGPADTVVRLRWATPVVSDAVTVPADALYLDPIRPLGLRAVYRRGDTFTGPPSLEVNEPSPYIYYHVPPVPYPFTVELTGRLLAPATGVYRFRAETISSAEVEIDGRSILTTRTNTPADGIQVELTSGLHSIRITHVASGNYAHLYLQWRLPQEQTFQRIQPTYLRPW